MGFSKELLKGTAEYIVLNALSDLGEAYGYQLIKTIAKSSDDLFAFQEGTLYPLLYRLEEKGYVDSKKRTGPNGKERRYYTITKEGTRVLGEGKRELKLFMRGLKSTLELCV